MWPKLRPSIFAVIASFSSVAIASVLSADAELAKGATSFNLGVDTSFKNETEQALKFAGFNAYIGGDSVKTENTSTNETTTTKTQNLGASIRLIIVDDWKFTLSGFSSNTPETKYKESGGQAKLEYKFSDAWSAGIVGGNSTIEQKYSITILNRTYERELNIEKQYTGLMVGYSFEDFFSVKLAANFYKYSKSKSDFQTAYQNQFLNNYATTLVSSISGLPESTISLDASYNYSEDIEISLYLQNSKLIVDDSNTQRVELMVTKYFNEVSGGIGVGQSRYKDGNSGSLLLNLGYDF